MVEEIVVYGIQNGLMNNYMRFWKEKTLLQFIASIIWNTSESLKIPLGKFSPIIFGWIINSKGKKLK
mgnify:CR=1 FL=1